MHNVGLINHTHQHTQLHMQAQKMQVNLTAEVLFEYLIKQKREGQGPMQGQTRYVGGQWLVKPASIFSSTEQSEEKTP